MVRRKLLGSALVVLTCAAVAISYLLNQEKNQVPMAPPVPQPTANGAADLRVFAQKRIFFGHQSVGENILSGVRSVYESAGGPAPTYRETADAGKLDHGGAPGVLVHAAIGANGDPASKIAEFDRIIRSGMGDRVDVALIKLCYVDFDRFSDPMSVFEKYRNTMAALERDFPNVKFIYTTAPLMTEGQLPNWQRTRFNSLVRTELKNKTVFDIAGLEATSQSGHHATQSMLGLGYESLLPEYSTDGGHLNAVGAERTARALLALVAAS